MAAIKNTQEVEEAFSLNSTWASLPDAGADDYLTKPFSVGELLARIRERWGAYIQRYGY